MKQEYGTTSAKYDALAKVAENYGSKLKLFSEWTKSVNLKPKLYS